MKSKLNWCGLCMMLALAMCLTVFAAGCDEQDVERVLAGVDVIVNYDDNQEVDFEDWFEQEWDQWF